MYRFVVALAVALLTERILLAEPTPTVTSDAVLPSPVYQPPLALLPPNPQPPIMEYPPPGENMAVRGEVPWCKSPYQNSAWRIGVDLIPTVSHISDDAFGGWTENGALALRLNLGFEGDDGFGTRLLFWGFGQTADTPVGDVELDASTFYWDFYKRFFVQDAELTLGGGLAGAHMEYDVKAFDQKADVSAGGISMFGEGFYPLWKFERTDIGSVGRARIALLTGSWRDHGTPFVDSTDNDMMTIIELAWGIEIRHRFGQKQDKYWYIDFVPELQRWESATLPDICEPGFDGTNISFGLAW